MFRITLKRSLVALAVCGGLFAVAGPASAAPTGDPKVAPPPTLNVPIGPERLTEGSFTVDPQDGATRLKADGNEVAIESVTLGLASGPAERNNIWDTREGSNKVAGPATAGAAGPYQREHLAHCHR